MARGRRDPQRGAPKKLTAAARHWARGGRQAPDVSVQRAELAALGVPPERLDDVLPEETAAANESFRVWPENERTVRAFLELEQGWQEGRTADGSARMVLDTGQIKHTLELLAVKRREWPDVFNGLRVMESAAVAAILGVEE